MTLAAGLEIALCFALLLVLVKPLGAYMARVYENRPILIDRALGPVERLLYRFARVQPAEEMTWKGYALAFLTLQLVGLALLYAIQRLQGWLPLNPQRMGAVPPLLAFNTATSFVTNTNWQAYGGEATLSYLTQMAGLTVQNFVSAASGMAVLVALIRGFSRRTSRTIGNFWVDLVRSTLYILVPLSLIVALLLLSQGVIQNFSSYRAVPVVQAVHDQAGRVVTEQVLPAGPVASQVAIKELGTNGGGFFNGNSAHPFENPTPLSNLVELLSILLIPAALCYTYGRMTGNTLHGWVLLGVMLIILVPLQLGCLAAEQSGNPTFTSMGIDQTARAASAGGNMEGKEVRFGVVGSALWATWTTAASNGSVNSMHDSFTPLGGLVPMLLIQFGEVVFGGVGSGLYGMIAFVIVTVFVAGLMVGRTPEYLGKKIEAYEMKMASLVILIPAAIILIMTATAVSLPAGKGAILNPGPHGFSEVLYAFTSAAGNNGSAFAGLKADTPFYDVATAILMFIGRYWVAIPVLALAGSLARKKLIPPGSGTLQTHTYLFLLFLVSVIVIVGVLTFIPAIALGPVAEHLMVHG